MVNYTWNGATSPLASNNANWTPNGSPTVGDTVIFDATAAGTCEFDLATTVDNFIIQSDYNNSFIVAFTADVSVKFAMEINRATVIDAGGGARKIKFTDAPTVAFQHIVMNTENASPFVNEPARNDITFEFSFMQKFQNGIYPHMELLSGIVPGYNVSSPNTTKEVRMLSFYFDGLTSVSLPSAEDREMKFIIEGDTRPAGGQSFMVNTANQFIFDSGYGEWTLQTMSNGFAIPVAGNTFFDKWKFIWRNLVINPSSTGTGLATLQWGSILSLTNLTVNSGVILGGASDKGATIHCVNRPTIKGSWGFVQVADGIYHYKNHFRLNVAFGGTGLDTVGSGEIVFGDNARSLNSNATFTFNTSTQSLHLGTGGLTFSDGTTQTTAATGGGGGGGGITVQDEGVALATVGTTLNFVDGQHSVATVPTAQPLCVQATGTGAVKTITIDGSKVRTDVSDTLPTYLDAKLQTGANMSITLDTTNAATTGHAFTFAADNNKVAGTAADTAAFLSQKILAGTNISFSISTHATYGQQMTINATGGGGGGYPLFRHDQNPTVNNFSPFRLLVNNDSIELGTASGGDDNHDVSVFTPQTDESNPVSIGITAIGAVGTNTGREYIFYGQGRRAADSTIYTTVPITNGGYPVYFVESMRDVPVGTGAPFFGMATLQVFSGDGVNNVRVIDAGEHTVLNASQVGGTPPDPESEEPPPPSTVRILLLADFQLVDDGRGRFNPNYRLRESL